MCHSHTDTPTSLYRIGYKIKIGHKIRIGYKIRMMIGQFICADIQNSVPSRAMATIERVNKTPQSGKTHWGDLCPATEGPMLLAGRPGGSEASAMRSRVRSIRWDVDGRAL